MLHNTVVVGFVIRKRFKRRYAWQEGSEYETDDDSVPPLERIPDYDTDEDSVPQ
jgi:hypothetical protein